MKASVLYIYLAINFLFWACEPKVKNEHQVIHKEKKDSLIDPTTITFLDTDLLFIPTDWRSSNLTKDHLNQSDSVLLVQCCQPGACNQCYEFNSAKSKNILADFDKGRWTYYIRKVVLTGELLKDFKELYNSQAYYSTKGPESTCCLKYLFISYKNGEVTGTYRIDDCFHCRGYLTKKGIHKLKEIVENSGLKFHFYFDESYFE